MAACAVPSDPEETSAHPQDDAETPHDPVGSELATAIARAYRGARPGLSGRRGPARRRRADRELSGAWPDNRDPQLLSAAVSRLVTEHGWATDVAVHGVFGRWDSIVGAEVGSHCRPERFVDGRLRVRADSTAWATQVRLLAPIVLLRLNTELGEGTVRQVEVVGPQAPSWRHGRFAVRDTRGPRDTYG